MEFQTAPMLALVLMTVLTQIQMASLMVVMTSSIRIQMGLQTQMTNAWDMMILLI